MVLNQPKPSIERICSKTTTGLAWIEPNGTVNWLNPRNTHGQWAYFYNRPQRDDGTWAPVEDTATYNRLLEEGWIRVSNVLNLTVDELDTPPPAAWDAWAMIATECRISPEMDAEASIVGIEAGSRGTGYVAMSIADVVERFCSRRGKESFWSSMMSESMIRRIVREILKESLTSFQDKTRTIQFKHPFEDPTFEKNPTSKLVARQLKQAWNAEADHDFMKTVTKIHWLRGEDASKLNRFLTTSSRNEISTMGYLKPPYYTTWGNVGIVIEGRVTLASNSMDSLYSGYHSSLPQEIGRQYSSSGIPRRPTLHNVHLNLDFILDAGSFRKNMQGKNEFIVDNWRPVGIVLEPSLADDIKKTRMFDSSDSDHYKNINRLVETIDSSGLPFLVKSDEDLIKGWL